MEKRIIEVPISIMLTKEQEEKVNLLFDANDIAYNFALSQALQTAQQTGTMSYSIESWIQYLRQSFQNNPLYPNIMDPNLVEPGIILSSLYQLDKDLQTYMKGGPCPRERRNFAGLSRSYYIWIEDYQNQILNKSFIFVPGLNSYVSIPDQIAPSIINNKILGICVAKYNFQYTVILISEQAINTINNSSIFDNKDAVGLYVDPDRYDCISISTGDVYYIPPEILSNIEKLRALYKEYNKRKAECLDVSAQDRRIAKWTLLIQKQFPAWHTHIAYKLLHMHQTIFSEYQPRNAGISLVIEGNKIIIPGWLQFFSQFYEIKKYQNLPNNIIKIYKSTDHLSTCSNCGHKLPYTKFFDPWVCPICNTQHDLQINAAKNILIAGLNNKV